MNKILKVGYDQDVECPMTSCDGMWTLKSFNRNSIHSVNPESIFPNGKMPLWLRNKFKVGLAFFLDYYEHGLGAYSLSGEGMQCQWDTAGCAGVLIWEHPPSDMGAKTVEERKKDARAFLDEYNDWMNGNCYYFSVETIDGEEIDSCGGLIGTDHLEDVLLGCLESGDKVKVKDKIGVTSFIKWPSGVEVVKEFEEVEEIKAGALGKLSKVERHVLGV